MNGEFKMIMETLADCFMLARVNEDYELMVDINHALQSLEKIKGAIGEKENPRSR